MSIANCEQALVGRRRNYQIALKRKELILRRWFDMSKVHGSVVAKKIRQKVVPRAIASNRTAVSWGDSSQEAYGFEARDGRVGPSGRDCS